MGSNIEMSEPFDNINTDEFEFCDATQLRAIHLTSAIKSDSDARFVRSCGLSPKVCGVKWRLAREKATWSMRSPQWSEKASFIPHCVVGFTHLRGDAYA
jgi:hypothetical protein